MPLRFCSGWLYTNTPLVVVMNARKSVSSCPCHSLPLSLGFSTVKSNPCAATHMGLRAMPLVKRFLRTLAYEELPSPNPWSSITRCAHASLFHSSFLILLGVSVSIICSNRLWVSPPRVAVPLTHLWHTTQYLQAWMYISSYFLNYTW